MLANMRKIVEEVRLLSSPAPIGKLGSAVRRIAHPHMHVHVRTHMHIHTHYAILCHYSLSVTVTCKSAVQKAIVKEQLEEEVQRTANDDEKYRQMLSEFRAKIEQVRLPSWPCDVICSVH